ncbi:hypothetical protein ACEPAI_4107 [Sanghuangporus weigelae]
MARAASPSANPTPPSEFRHSGFTHTLFFDHPPSANNDDRVLKDLRYAIKQGEKRDNASKTEDEKYGLYYYNVLDESSERRASNSIRRLIPGKFEPMRDYSKLIEKCHKKIVDNYMIDEEEEIRDYICILGVGEGAYPAIAIAQILSKVGIIQKWALELEDSSSLVIKLGTSGRYNDKARENFRFIRTRFARVDLFCLDKDIPGSDKVGENIGDSRHCSRDKLPNEYMFFQNPALKYEQAIVPQVSPERVIAVESKSAENIQKDPGRSTN